MRWLSWRWSPVVLILLPPLAPRARATEPGEALPVVAILTMESAGLPSGDAQFITELVRAAAVQRGYWRVVEREELTRVLSEQALSLAGCFEAKCAIRVGRMLGARYVVTGSCNIMDNVPVAVEKLIEVETGRVLRMAVEHGFLEDGPMVAADRLVRGLDGRQSGPPQKRTSSIPFVGEIRRRWTSSGTMGMESVLLCRPGYVRSPVTIGSSDYMVLDKARGVRCEVSDRDRTWTETRLPGVADGVAGTMLARKTDLTRVIAGYTCTAWRVPHRMGFLTFWLTTSLGTLWDPWLGATTWNGPRVSLPPDSFSMEFQDEANSTLAYGAFEVTSVEWKSCPESLFRPPAGYLVKTEARMP